MTDVLPCWPGEMVHVGDQRLHVRRAGPVADTGRASGAEPAVLVHGLGGSATNWTDLMGLLRDRLQLVAPDLPGFGWSPPPVDADYTLAAHARVVTRLIEVVADGAPVHLFGNSLGGAVATIVAGRRPDLVRTLTLVSPALPSYRPRLSNAHLPALATPFLGDRLARRLSTTPAEQRVRATLALCFADPASISRRRYEEAVAEARRRERLRHGTDALLASLRGLLASYFARGADAPWRMAARVQAVTLLVYGGQDKLVDPRSAGRAARTFAVNRLLMLPDSGHVAQMEHPEVLARAVRELLDAAAPATSGESVSPTRG